MKKKFNKLFDKTIKNDYFIMDIVFFVGFFIITCTNFYLNLYFGLYFLGTELIALSVFLYKFSKKRGGKK